MSNTNGKVVFENGAYALIVGQDRYALPVEVIGAEELSKLQGKDVEVMLSEPITVPVAIKLPTRKPILCYVPPPDRWLDFSQAWAHLAETHTEAIAATASNPILKKLLQTCYLPRDWVIRGVEDQVRTNLANELLAAGVIGKETHAQITTARTTQT